MDFYILILGGRLWEILITKSKSSFTLHASYEIFKPTIDVLVDKAIIDEDDIKEVLKEFEIIKSVHKIRSRGSENNVYIDMHIMLDPNVTVEGSHMLNHDIENLIREKINKSAQVIVHIEPYYKE